MKAIVYKLYANEDRKELQQEYEYDVLNNSEVTTRQSCEYFIKENKSYKILTSTVMPEGGVVLEGHFVEETEPYKDMSSDVSYRDRIVLEVRNIKSLKLVHVFEFESHGESARMIRSDFIFVPITHAKYQKWSLDSSEVDEDRGCYVYYGNPLEDILS
jgi:hypothetical protein